MSRSHTGVKNLNFCYVKILRRFGAYFIELLSDLRLLLGFGQIIFPAHFFGNLFFRFNTLRLRFMPSHFVQATTVRIDALVLALVNIDSAKAVFNHIANYPIGSKKLRCRRNSLLADFDILFQLRKCIVLKLNIIILIHPTDYLNGVLPILCRDIINHSFKHVAGLQKIIREQKLRVILDFFKHSRQTFAKCVALRDDEILIQILIILLLDKFIYLFFVDPVKLDRHRFFQYFGIKFVIFVAENSHSRRQKIIDLHIAQGDKAIEPCIGNLLHHLLITFLTNLRNQRRTLFLLRIGQQPSACGHVRIVVVALLLDFIFKSLLPDRFNKLHSRLYRKLFYSIFIHYKLPHFFSD